MNNGNLSLVINGLSYSGWQSIRITRSCEHFPSSFELTFAQKEPEGGAPPFKPFDSCQVYLDSDLVLTGYIDVINQTLDASSHNITVSGRSKCEDLTDCSAEFPPSDGGLDGVPVMVHTNGTIQRIATELCKVYGINVKNQSQQQFNPVPVYQVTIGETPYEIIERFAKAQQVLVYDDTDGSLIIADLHNGSMASGFAVGKNIQSIALNKDWSQRMSEIDVFDQTAYSQTTTGATNPPGVAKDDTIRHRRLMMISEQPFVPQQEWKSQRANWEMNRRIGRSQMINIVTDSWRDSAGTLWTPNFYVTVDAPYIGINQAKWVISTVTFSKDLNSGTTASLLIMPPEAFAIEPYVIQSQDPGLALPNPDPNAPSKIVVDSGTA